jgi:integrase
VLSRSKVKPVRLPAIRRGDPRHLKRLLADMAQNRVGLPVVQNPHTNDMSRQRTNELVSCRYFNWRLYKRGKVWCADGRSNRHNAGRHSLGTSERDEALRLLARLDVTVAVNLGLAPAEEAEKTEPKALTLEEGRRLYEEHISRPQAVGGVRPSTSKRYRAVFDKFIPFAKGIGVLTWNKVTKAVLHRYAKYLEDSDYHGKTIRNEMVTLIQTFKWLMGEKHVTGVEPLKLKLRKVESTKPYCYRPAEIAAMVKQCESNPRFASLRAILVALATTGLRISELAKLKWSDIDLERGVLLLIDESAQAKSKGDSRRSMKSHDGRSLPLHVDLRRVLLELRRVDQYVFHGPRGGRLKPDTTRNCLVRDVIKPLALKFQNCSSGRYFADGRLHGFRHAFVSNAANTGVPERIVMEWLGHKHSDMVRHYYTLHDEESRRQMDRLDPLGDNAGKQSPGPDDGTAKPNQEESS